LTSELFYETTKSLKHKNHQTSRTWTCAAYWKQGNKFI
jgi:hypothetical protein